MNIEVKPATLKDLVYVDSLQKKNAEELSFYPSAVFEREIENHRIVMAFINNDPVGYLYHGALGNRVKIHQACIQYDARGYLYGSQLVRWLVDMCKAANSLSITLRCGSDISANGFWKAMGFYCQSVTPGGVRRMRDINEWRKDLHPQLFTQVCEPSDKSQDASLWRKRKVNLGSQFLRGRAIQEYRKAIVDGSDDLGAVDAAGDVSAVPSPAAEGDS
jgi:hypothetical protein